MSRYEEPGMTTEKAIIELERYNRWRRGKGCVAPNPKAVSLAIEKAIEVMKLNIKKK